MCEAAVGYGGTFDPDYAYSPTGALFATTFNGLNVMRTAGDSCTFAATPPGNTSCRPTSSAPTARVLRRRGSDTTARSIKLDTTTA